VYVDAVAQPEAAQENRRPPGTAFFANYYQENGVFELGGGPVSGADYELNVTTTSWRANLTHFTIDNQLQDEVRNQLINHINP